MQEEQFPALYMARGNGSAAAGLPAISGTGGTDGHGNLAALEHHNLGNKRGGHGADQRAIIEAESDLGTNGHAVAAGVHDEVVAAGPHDLDAGRRVETARIGVRSPHDSRLHRRQGGSKIAVENHDFLENYMK